MSNSPKVKAAIQAVLKELRLLSPEEFWKAVDAARGETEVAKPAYYLQGDGTTYVVGQDPEVTCGHCGKTFLCDMMDAACRLCGEWYSESRIKRYGSNRKDRG